MKIKILVFPMVLALSVVIAIAYMWPQYGSLRGAIKELKESEATLQSVVEKKNNIENLKGSLKSNQDKQSFVLDFLPINKNEENIIDGLNYLASGSGVALANLLLEDTRSAAAIAAEESATTASSSKDILFSNASSGSGESSIIQPWDAQPRSVEVEVDVAGKYENIKTFLEQVYKMEMFNTVASLKIEKQESRSEEGIPADLGLLSATLKMSFGYLPEIQIGRNLSAPIFSQSSFNFGPYERLTSLVSKNIPTLETGERGKANPFLP
jgi:Tfp pilus assembly protein PilO